jgi:hypothetical protein
MHLVEKPKNLLDSAPDAASQYWLCEFCGQVNAIDISPEEMPQSAVVDYFVAPPVAESKEDSNIVFCIDISGSMGVTHELAGKLKLKGSEKREKEFRELGVRDRYVPGQPTNVTYVSRLQCVQSAIESQIEKLAKEYPNKHVWYEVTLLF